MSRIGFSKLNKKNFSEQKMIILFLSYEKGQRRLVDESSLACGLVAIASKV